MRKAGATIPSSLPPSSLLPHLVPSPTLTSSPLTAARSFVHNTSLLAIVREDAASPCELFNNSSRTIGGEPLFDSGGCEKVQILLQRHHPHCRFHRLDRTSSNRTSDSIDRQSPHPIPLAQPTRFAIREQPPTAEGQNRSNSAELVATVPRRLIPQRHRAL